MGKILVLYDSQTGNTADMARYVGEDVERVEGSSLRLLSVDEASKDDFEWCDGIAVGSPTNMVSLYVDGNAEKHPLKTRRHIVPE